MKTPEETKPKQAQALAAREAGEMPWLDDLPFLIYSNPARGVRVAGAGSWTVLRMGKPRLALSRATHESGVHVAGPVDGRCLSALSRV